MFAPVWQTMPAISMEYHLALYTEHKSNQETHGNHSKRMKQLKFLQHFHSCKPTIINKQVNDSHITHKYGLLTKLFWSRWLDIGQALFFACLWTETQSKASKLHLACSGSQSQRRILFILIQLLWLRLMDPWCSQWTYLLLIQFSHIVTSLLRERRSRYQGPVVQNRD